MTVSSFEIVARDKIWTIDHEVPFEDYDGLSESELVEFGFTEVGPYVVTQFADDTTAGTATAYTLAITDPAFTELVDGMTFTETIHFTCGETPTLDIESTGVKNLVKQTGETLISGELVADRVYQWSYNETDDVFVVQNVSEIPFNDLLDRITAETEMAVAGITLSSQYADVGNIGNGEDDLMTYSLPAGKLATDGSYLEMTGFGTFASNGETKRLQVYFGAMVLYDSDIQAQVGGNREFKATIIRTGATTQRAICTFNTDANLFTSGDTKYTTPAETLSGAVTIKATAACVGAGTATNNDIVQKGLTIKYYA